MDDKKVPTCGECIHADVCEQNPLHTEFSRDNPAYCEGFKDKSKLVEVVRCKDCKHYKTHNRSVKWNCKALYCARSAVIRVKPDDFCSYGERRSENV